MFRAEPRRDRPSERPRDRGWIFVLFYFFKFCFFFLFLEKLNINSRHFGSAVERPTLHVQHNGSSPALLIHKYSNKYVV